MTIFIPKIVLYILGIPFALISIAIFIVGTLVTYAIIQQIREN